MLSGAKCSIPLKRIPVGTGSFCKISGPLMPQGSVLHLWQTVLPEYISQFVKWSSNSIFSVSENLQSHLVISNWKHIVHIRLICDLSKLKSSRTCSYRANCPAVYQNYEHLHCSSSSSNSHQRQKSDNTIFLLANLIQCSHVLVKQES